MQQYRNRRRGENREGQSSRGMRDLRREEDKEEGEEEEYEADPILYRPAPINPGKAQCMLTGFSKRRRILCVQGAGVSVVRSLLTVIHALTHFVWDRTLRDHVGFVNVAVGIARVAE